MTAGWVDVVAGILWRDGKVLVAERKTKESREVPLWEFPGGKQEPGESLPESLARELREELGVEIESIEFLTTVKHRYPHIAIRLHCFQAGLKITSNSPVGLEGQAVQWVNPEMLSQLTLTQADLKIIHLICDPENLKRRRAASG